MKVLAYLEGAKADGQLDYTVVGVGVDGLVSPAALLAAATPARAPKVSPRARAVCARTCGCGGGQAVFPAAGDGGHQRDACEQRDGRHPGGFRVFVLVRSPRAQLRPEMCRTQTFWLPVAHASPEAEPRSLQP